MNSHCFLRSSPENRVSPRASPNHHISKGPFNKVSVLELFLLQEQFIHFIHRVLIPRVFPLSLCYSSSLLLPSLPSYYSPPPLLLRPPRRESLPAMRRPSNRAATCMSTMFHRLDAHQPQSTHHSTPLKPYSTFFQQFSAAVSFRIGVFFLVQLFNLEELFRFWCTSFKFLNLVGYPFRFPRQPASRWMTCSTFSQRVEVRRCMQTVQTQNIVFSVSKF